MNFEDYKKEVDRIAMDRYMITYTGENGEDCKILKDSHEAGDETPEEFVDWWAEKYDLIQF